MKFPTMKSPDIARNRDIQLSSSTFSPFLFSHYKAPLLSENIDNKVPPAQNISLTRSIKNKIFQFVFPFFLKRLSKL